jgi:hypothetical protein
MINFLNFFRNPKSGFSASKTGALASGVGGCLMALTGIIVGNNKYYNIGASSLLSIMGTCISMAKFADQYPNDIYHPDSIHALLGGLGNAYIASTLHQKYGLSLEFSYLLSTLITFSALSVIEACVPQEEQNTRSAMRP